MLHNTQLKVCRDGSFQSLSCFIQIRNERMWCLFFIILTFKAVSKLIHVIITENFLFWCTGPHNRFIVHSDSQCAVAGLRVTTCTIQMLCCPFIIIESLAVLLYHTPHYGNCDVLKFKKNMLCFTLFATGKSSMYEITFN